MNDPLSGAWEAQRAALGTFIRSQRLLSNMSLREFSALTRVSNAYLSQLERGLYDPTLRVLIQIADALQMSVEELLASITDESELADDYESSASVQRVEDAVRADPNLTAPEKDALLTVYRSYLGSAGEDSSAE